jgi:hypothetical protein
MDLISSINHLQKVQDWTGKLIENLGFCLLYFTSVLWKSKEGNTYHPRVMKVHIKRMISFTDI